MFNRYFVDCFLEDVFMKFKIRRCLVDDFFDCFLVDFLLLVF